MSSVKNNRALRMRRSARRRGLCYRAAGSSSTRRARRRIRRPRSIGARVPPRQRARRAPSVTCRYSGAYGRHFDAKSRELRAHDVQFRGVGVHVAVGGRIRRDRRVDVEAVDRRIRIGGPRFVRELAIRGNDGGRRDRRRRRPGGRDGTTRISRRHNRSLPGRRRPRQVAPERPTESRPSRLRPGLRRERRPRVDV